MYETTHAVNKIQFITSITSPKYFGLYFFVLNNPLRMAHSGAETGSLIPVTNYVLLSASVG
jgi:hypothetical protein